MIKNYPLLNLIITNIANCLGIKRSNMIKKTWLKYFDLTDFNMIVEKYKLSYYISIDCASGIGTENDFTAISIFSVYENKFYLCEMIRLKLQYPELKSKIENLISNYKPISILIEDKSNGSSMIQDLQQNHNNIISIKPTKSKEFRVNSILTTLESGNLLIAKNQVWSNELEIELLSFPSCKHDDQVDSISQFINWYNSSRILLKDLPKIRKL